MQEKHLFEYAVIRVVPRVEREEFLNVGVIVYCASQRFLQTKYELDEHRLQAFSGYLDFGELKERLYAFEQICIGTSEGGTIGKLPIASRFRWLAALLYKHHRFTPDCVQMHWKHCSNYMHNLYNRKMQKYFRQYWHIQEKFFLHCRIIFCIKILKLQYVIKP